MLYKYFQFTKKRVILFSIVSILIFTLQILLTGSILARQKETTEAGNSESAVIGVLDQTEIVRQKFRFNRKIILKEFALSFGSFQRKDVGDVLNIQMTDADNNIVYSTKINVDEITSNATYRIPMKYTVTIPKGVTCCIKIYCSSKNSQYDTIPTLNTTNRTDPNTYLSTMKMQTRKKSLNISYTYYYHQIFPLFAIIFEFLILFFLCFERITSYRERLIRQYNKQIRKKEHEKIIAQEAKQKREKGRNHSAKIRYSRDNTRNKKQEHKKKNIQKKKNKHQWNKNKKTFSIKEFVKWCLIEPKVIKWIRIVSVILNPLLIMFMIELMNETLLSMSPQVWIFTWILLLSLQYLFYAIFGDINIAMLILNCILFPSGLANLILMNVRGTPFLPSDLMALGTATEVASTYSISLKPAQFVMLSAFIVWCFFLYRLKKKKKKITRKKIVIKHAIPLIISCFMIGILYQTPILSAAKIEDNVWNKVASCRNNGFYMNFFLNIHYLSVSKPSGYSEDEVKTILTDFKKENQKTLANTSSEKPKYNKDFSTNTKLQGQKPNIIMIMNESLADYDQIGKTNYTQDPLSFIHSMKENTIYGKDYVSIYGAGTSNSEFEAMTGNTMSFFPSGCNVYQQFMHNSTYSLAYYLKSLGYDTSAVHPSSGANWNRINTYNSMRFNRFLTIEDFKNPEYVRYISDKESYKKVIEVYEKKKKGTPMFTFDMTIQNHGGYLTNTNWKNPVTVKGAYYQEANEYLSAIKVSDDAFKYLVDYFKKQKEPTIICMFGDHQPSIETEFYEELMKKKQNDWELDDIQKRYVTPFVIWANYDIEQGQDVILSNNYLENLLLKQAGIKLPLYNQYIEKVSQTIPAMNVNGYLDFSGKWHKYDSDENNAVKNILNNYEILQYGYYSDSNKAKMNQLFEMSK